MTDAPTDAPTTTLTDDYAKAGFGGSLQPGEKLAVLVVDLVQAYLDPSSPLYAGVEDALASNERLVAAARDAGVPVVWSNVEYEPGGADGGVFYRKVASLQVFDRGGPLGAFPQTCRPAPGEKVVTKQYPSAFFGTDLAAHLHDAGVDTLLITGFSTSGCVRASALDALCHGFIPVVVRDACGDRDDRPHEANLFDLQAKYAEVVGEGEALELLRG